MYLFEHKSVYIHIPKTGGTSIRRVLRELPHVVDAGHSTLRQHAERFDLLHQRKNIKVEKGEWDDYKTFTIVRNPWDRLVSEWKWFTHVHPREAIKSRYRGMNFKKFADHFFHSKPFGDYRHRRPQVHFLYHNDNLIQHIYRFEELQQSFASICDLLKISNNGLGHHYKSSREHYSIYYDTHTRKIVEDKWGADIDLLKYTF